MKRHTLKLMLLALVVLGTGTLMWSQEGPPAPPAEQPPQTQQAWSADQLDNMVAPIALYPDPLLGQMLVAATYPLEVVEANQWLQRNRNLRGQALVDAARQQPWDPSVQALVAVPDALAKLSQDVQWTTDLGNAFLAQQTDVMNAVQRMRARAKDNGRLASTPQQIVTTENQDGQQAIVIQPASPQVIYVPAYDPYYIWGPPVYGYYPPLYYPAYGWGFGIGFDLGFCFGGWGGWGLWGWGPSWFGHSIFCNNYFFHHYGYHSGFRGGFRGRSVWMHDAGHRLGVPYGNSRVAAHFGGRAFSNRSAFAGGSAARSALARNPSRYSAGPGASPSGRAGRTLGSQAPRAQNQFRQGYQGSRQSLSSAQGFRSAPQQYRGATNQFRASTDRYRSAPQQFRSAPQQYRTAPQQFRSAPQQYRSAPQMTYRSSPQRYGSGFQMYRPAPQQFRAAPQFRSAPQFSSRGGFGGYRSGGGSVGGGFRSGGGGFHSGGGFSGGRGSSGGGHRGR